MDGALPAEDAALVDDQRTYDDVAEHFAGCQDLEAARGGHVALDGPADYDIAPGDVALDPSVLAHRQVTFSCQVAVHFAVESDVGRGLQPAFELDLVAQHRLSDDGSGFARGSLVEHGKPPGKLLASCARTVTRSAFLHTRENPATLTKVTPGANRAGRSSRRSGART